MDAKERMIQSNLRLVVSIAKNYRNQGLPVPRPHPGGHARPHPGGREVRLASRLQVLDVRDVVDPPGRRARAGRQGAHDPHARPHRRATAADRSRRTAAVDAARPRAHARGDRRRGVAPARRCSRSGRPRARRRVSTPPSATATTPCSATSSPATSHSRGGGRAPPAHRRAPAALAALAQREQRGGLMRYGITGAEPQTLEEIGGTARAHAGACPADRARVAPASRAACARCRPVCPDVGQKEGQMRFHRNAKLGLAGRRELVLAIAGGLLDQSGSRTLQRLALDGAPLVASLATGRRGRASEASPVFSIARADQPAVRVVSLPERSDAICECRRKTGWGPRLVAGATGFAHSTVWKVLRRFGLSRPPRPAREPANRYEWPCPGDLLHMDVSRYARFLRRAIASPAIARARRRRRAPGRLRLRARGRRRPLAARLRRDPRRRARRDRARPSSSERSPSSPSTGSRPGG